MPSSSMVILLPDGLFVMSMVNRTQKWLPAASGPSTLELCTSWLATHHCVLPITASSPFDSREPSGMGVASTLTMSFEYKDLIASSNFPCLQRSTNCFPTSCVVMCVPFLSGLLSETDLSLRILPLAHNGKMSGVVLI